MHILGIQVEMFHLLKRGIRTCILLQLQWMWFYLCMINELFPSQAFPITTEQPDLYWWPDIEFTDTNISGNIHVRVKRSNDSAPPPKQYANAIEEFYADPNNRAMYLVLPLIVLIYGGCSSIYCIHKCCRYVKRKKLEKEMQSRERLTSETESCSGIEDTEEKLHFEPERESSPVYKENIHITEKKNSPPPAYEQTRQKVEAMPLEDVEESNDAHLNKIENIQHKETSFIERKDNGQVVEKIKTPEVSKNTPRRNIDSRSSSMMSSIRPKPSPPPAYEKRTSPDGKSSKGKELFELTPRDIEDILNYYSDKKHMPDVIPDDTENVVPLRKKVTKWKHRVFNG
ncbi:uncharacterized protein LOC133174761 [Saccostrea echinata]|uniref:uncharacterized protein LOC133174761 n=1 Tax=Saccostrea echinata TaxID=191078 RepID=UPI002A830D38|nr:uncharacterized protein LOC133174761 [Saccostrea echinata]